MQVLALGLVAVGVDGELFQKVAGKLAQSGDLEKAPYVSFSCTG